MSDAIERLSRAAAEEAWRGVGDDATLGRMVEHGWPAFAPLVRVVCRELLRLYESETYTDVDPTFVENFRRRHGLEG